MHDFPANYKHAEMLKDNAAFILKALPKQNSKQQNEQGAEQ